MESIKYFLQPPSRKGIQKGRGRLTERGELLRYYLETLNRSREKAGFKKLTFPRVAHLVQGLDISTLYYLKSCMKERDDEAASKFFYYSLRPKEENEPQ